MELLLLLAEVILEVFKEEAPFQLALKDGPQFVHLQNEALNKRLN